jgi:hypothetical protein
MAYCQAMPPPVLQFTPRSLNPELFGWVILSKPLCTEPRMPGARAAARTQLIRASNLGPPRPRIKIGPGNFARSVCASPLMCAVERGGRPKVCSASVT